MPNIDFIVGTKEEIPRKYLPELFEFMIQNRKELFPTETPKLEFFKQKWVIALPEEQRKKYVIVINGERVIGYGYISWNIKYDNLDRGYFWIFVMKSERRKLIGTKILLQLIKLCPPEIKILGTEIFDETDAINFIKTFNTKEKSIEVLSSSDLSQFNLEEVQIEAQKQKDLALEKGYDIIFIDDIEFVLHLDLPKFVEMEEEIWNDMPKEELTYKNDVVTIERYLQMIQYDQLVGYHRYTFVAIHKESDTPVGLTCSAINKYYSDFAEQFDTGVIRSHRGKGLGLALKYQMLHKLLKDTKVKFWRTGNAGSNEYMLRINRCLKFKPYTKEFIYEFSKEDLVQMLNNTLANSTDLFRINQ
ncbi:MAG: hypothetical protein JXA54_13865 [Candidatus Heimdallarchaeota archaeon]|nr:hypothetical protein [Candidatus Heimdallarchaeota archaeon]